MADLIEKRSPQERLIIAKTLIESVLDDLPSAQPTQTNTPNALESLDCISRQAAIDAIQNADTQIYEGEAAVGRRNYMTKDECCEIIDSLPSAQPPIEERKTGRWEEIEVIAEAYDIAGVKTWASKMQCDQCGFSTFAIEGCFSQYHFCPNCGARMEVEHD